MRSMMMIGSPITGFQQWEQKGAEKVSREKRNGINQKIKIPKVFEKLKPVSFVRNGFSHTNSTAKKHENGSWLQNRWPVLVELGWTEWSNSVTRTLLSFTTVKYGHPLKEYEESIVPPVRRLKSPKEDMCSTCVDRSFNPWCPCAHCGSKCIINGHSKLQWPIDLEIAAPIRKDIQ